MFGILFVSMILLNPPLRVSNGASVIGPHEAQFSLNLGPSLIRPEVASSDYLFPTRPDKARISANPIVQFLLYSPWFGYGTPGLVRSAFGILVGIPNYLQ